MIRVLYMNAKSDDPDRVAAEVAAVAAKLGAGVSVTSGLDDFNKRARADGGWHGWTTRTPGRYDLFVVPAETVGRATGEIVNAALCAGKKAILLPVGKELEIGTPKTVLRIDPGVEWKAGYCVVTA